MAAMPEQSNAAAERSAHPDRGRIVPWSSDDRPVFVVEVVSSGGEVLRQWECRLTDTEADGATAQIRRKT